jgi:hypothetical protein
MIRHEDAKYLHTVNLTPEEIERGELQRLQVAGMNRWVRLTLGGVVFQYVMVMDAAHSPARTFINTFPALIAGVRVGPNNTILFVPTGKCGRSLRCMCIPTPRRPTRSTPRSGRASTATPT